MTSKRTSFETTERKYGIMSDLRDELEQNFTAAETQSEVKAEEENTNPTPAEPEEVIDAPLAYKQEYKDSFNTLPLDWRKYLAQREKEVELGISKANSKYNWLENIYNARKENLGFKDSKEYIENLVAIGDALNSDPAATISKLQSIFGISEQNNDVMQRQINQLNQALQQQQAFLQSQEDARFMNEIAAFRDAKDAEGNVLHPYFEDVRADMANLGRAGVGTLEEAYERAIWGNPSIREKLLQAQAKAELDKKVKQANEVKQASFEPTSKSTPKGKELTLREELERNFDNLGD